MKNPRIKEQKVTRVKTRSEKKSLGPVVSIWLPSPQNTPRHIADKNVKIQPVTCGKISMILQCQILGDMI